MLPVRGLAAVLILSCLLVGACGARVPKPGPLPPGASYTGVWDTNWGQLTLERHGTNVHGRYRGFRNGGLRGTIQGDLLLFKWTQVESEQYGRGYLRMTPDGRRLEGRWGYKKDRVHGGRWWATKVGQ